MSGAAAIPEFSHEIPVAEIEAAPVSVLLEADAGEREALAKRLDIESIESLVCDLDLRRLADQRTFEVKGALAATVTQVCVVTLEPFEAEVKDGFVLRFAKYAEAEELDLDPEEDAPEPIAEDRLDLGEITAQQLALSLDPHPRKPGAEVPENLLGEAAAESVPEKAGQNPFAKLAELKRKP